MKYFLIRRTLKYTAPVIQFFQQKATRKYSALPEKGQPVFIIGVPRSGTTLLFQIISNYFDILYPDNLVFFCRENPFMGFWLSQKIFNAKPHDNFRSSRGNTLEGGLHAPNQYPVFWDQHSKQLAYYSEGANLFSPRQQEGLYRQLYAVINKYQKNILFKGSVVGNNLPSFHEVFPGARFILYKRNPLYIAQSLILEAHSTQQDFENIWMNRIKPFNYQKIQDCKDDFKKAALYVHALSTVYEENLARLPSSHCISLSYEQVCNETITSMERVHHLLGKEQQTRENASLPVLKANNTRKLNDVEFRLLETEINKLQW